MGISTTPARFNADFGLFWPFRSLANTIQYGQYGPILAESVRFGVNRSQVNVNPREKKKKKFRRGTNTRATASDTASCFGLECGTLPAASVLSDRKSVV